MGSAKSHLRRLRYRRRPRVFAWGVVAVAVCGYWLVTPRPAGETVVLRQPVAEVETEVRPAAIRERGRPVYPYSIIPGGAWSQPELRSALSRDPVAAEHYKGFRE